jgi:hypothetical protein
MLALWDAETQRAGQPDGKQPAHHNLGPNGRGRNC